MFSREKGRVKVGRAQVVISAHVGWAEEEIDGGSVF